jgi:hypothetical protein
MGGETRINEQQLPARLRVAHDNGMFRFGQAGRGLIALPGNRAIVNRRQPFQKQL